jgi:hypothetical protein
MATGTIRPRDLLSADAAPLWRDLSEVPDLAEPAALARVRRAHPDADPALVAAIATQVGLRRRALDRLGRWSQEAILDAEAVQQATRAAVARYRAEAIAARWGLGHIADIGCGIGSDARALAEAGFEVRAIERDPWRAEAASVNLRPHAVEVVCADATQPASDVLDGCRIAYVDPARREHDGPRRIDGRRPHPLSDPSEWSPPWPWVMALSERMPVVAKVAPGFNARHAPLDADLEWIDHDGDTVEVTVWMGPGTRGERRATALAGGVTDSLACVGPTRDGLTTSQAQGLLIEPTPGVVRAGLVVSLAERLSAALLDGGQWLTADDVASTPLARAWRVITELPGEPRGVREWLRPYGAVTWKTIDAGVPAHEWDRRIGHRPARGGIPITLVVTGHDRVFAVERDLR